MLGPSNDNDPNVQIEIDAARAADGDEAWNSYEWVEGLHAAWSWDPARPLAEQWPWGPADPAHMARGDAMLDEVIAAAEVEHAREIQAIKDLAADAVPQDGWQERVAVAVIPGPEPESGVEVAAVECPREECEEGCTAVYGACVVETEEPR